MLITFIGCKKILPDSSLYPHTDGVSTGLSIIEAKNWYEQKPEIMLRSTIKDKLSFAIKNPLWNKAVTTGDSNYYIVELPVDFEKQPGVIITDSVNNFRIINPNDAIKLLVLKDKKSGIMKSAFMHVVSDNGIEDTSNTYATRNRNFSGFIFFTDLDGKLINGWSYKNGKIIKSTHPSTKKISKRIITGEAVSLMAPPEPEPVDCGTYTIVYLERYCVGDYCTPWTESDRETYPLFCTGGSSDGNDGGIVYTQHDEPEATPPSSEDVEAQIQNLPFALLFDVPCDSIKKWLAIATFQPGSAIIDKLNTVYSEMTAPGTSYDQPTMTFDDVARVQNINDAYSSVVNMDYFSVKVNTLPVVNGVRLTADQFLHYIRVNINNFVNTNISNFTPYKFGSTDDTNLWNSNSPTGAIVSIDIPGNGSVFTNDGSVITSYSTNDKWTFTTIHDPMNGGHPVSGNRNFGYTANADGSYTFYTQGVDRLTDIATNFLQLQPIKTFQPFYNADALWKSFQNDINNFVVSHSGSSIVQTPLTYRPDWQTVKDVLDGVKPLNTLSKLCP